MMTDEEIIKALALCSSEHLGCEDGCPYIPRDIKAQFCSDALKKDALDLINRQKAEIKRLENHSKEVAENCTFVMRENDKATNKRFLEALEVVKAEAIKEFIKGLKKYNESIYSEFKAKIINEDIDNFVKEMVGDEY